MGSMGGKVYTSAITSMAKELTAMANREEASRWKPMNFQPARNSGTFSTEGQNAHAAARAPGR